MPIDPNPCQAAANRILLIYRNTLLSRKTRGKEAIAVLLELSQTHGPASAHAALVFLPIWHHALLEMIQSMEAWNDDDIYVFCEESSLTTYDLDDLRKLSRDILTAGRQKELPRQLDEVARWLQVNAS